MFKVSNRNTRTRCEICSKLIIKILGIVIINFEHRRRSGIFIANFEHISHLALMFLLLTLNMYLPIGILLAHCIEVSKYTFPDILYAPFKFTGISLHLRQNFGILKTSIKIQFNYLFYFS